MRNRLVTDQDGRETVSSVLLSESEIADMLDLEETMHRCTGWDVTRYGSSMRCAKGEIVRWVWVRSRPVEEDTL